MLLSQDCNASEPACPVLVMDSLVFELHKTYHENKLQLLLSPLILYLQPGSDRHLAATTNTAAANSSTSNSKVGTSAASGGGGVSDVHLSNTNLTAPSTVASSHLHHRPQQQQQQCSAPIGINGGVGPALSHSHASNVNTSHSTSQANTSHGSSSGGATINPHPGGAAARGAAQHQAPGFVMLSGLQMRGHAMFSGVGRGLDAETLEYAWLVELTLGSLTGRITAPQLQQIVTGVETFVLTATDNENCFRPARPYHLCYHDQPQPDCTIDLAGPLEMVGGGSAKTQPAHQQHGITRASDDTKHHHQQQARTELLQEGNKYEQPRQEGSESHQLSSKAYSSLQHARQHFCPTSDTIKYKMVRVSVDAVHLHLLDASVDLSIQVSGC